jgi:hypothetical protein
VLRLMFKLHWILLTLAIALFSSFSYSFALPSSPTESSPDCSTLHSPKQRCSMGRRQQPPQLDRIAKDQPGGQPPRTSRNRPGGRGAGNLCAVSPGLLEQRNVIWSDRPLFLWKAPPKAMLQELVLFDQSEKILWQKSLAATDQSVLYAGQPLQPGQFYTWRLQWTLRDAEHTSGSADYTFQLMQPEQQQQIASELQTLTQRLQASGEDAETIANQQADYLASRSQPLWSDALKVLYSIEHPSSQTTQKIQLWIDTACGQ